MKDVTLTLIGPDKTGIVATLAKIATSHGGNWLDSRMMRLGGTFSGIVRIAIPEESLEALTGESTGFLGKNGFQCSLRPTDPDEAPVTGATAELSVSGQDHPGIVHRIFSAFQETGVNVEELSTGLQAAPWSGTPVFEAHARLFIPDGVSLDSLQSDLEALAGDLLVELEFNGA